MRPIKGVLYNAQGVVEDCIFCRIHKKTEPATIVFEDNSFVVFKTIDPATSCHLLITPRVHIKNASSLQSSQDIELIENMVKVGKTALENFGINENDAQFCFHIPPWNSIDHLHLHAIGNLSSMTWMGFLKYNSWGYFPWCKSAQNIIDELKLKSSLPSNEGLQSELKLNDASSISQPSSSAKADLSTSNIRPQSKM
eukprot:gene5905-8148_t